MVVLRTSSGMRVDRIFDRAVLCVVVGIGLGRLMNSVFVVVATGIYNRSFQNAIAHNTFLSEVPLVFSTSISARLRQTLIYLDANSSPPWPLQSKGRAGA